MTLLAFHNDPARQAEYLARVHAHFDADEIIKGVYWEEGKGCAVGCTVHSADHFAYETELGIPAPIAFLEDHIFESLPNGRAKAWPLDFLAAIPLGADMSGVIPQFMAWLMVDSTWGVERKTDDPEIKELCREVARRLLAGETTGPEADALTERLRNARAAWDVRAAWTAWTAWTARAARDAWTARDARDARDAWTARAAWTAWTAWAAFVVASADELLRLLADAPLEGNP